MGQICDFVKEVLISPPAPSSIWWYLFAVLALVPPTVLAAWLVALCVAKSPTILKQRLGTYTYTRVAWTWGCIAAGFLLLVNVLQLTIRDQFVSYLSAVPYFIVAACLIIIGFVHRRAAKADVGSIQKIVQAR